MRCKGTGYEITAATTTREICQACHGAGTSFDFNNAKGYRSYGPRWPTMEASKVNERQVIHWTATDAAKAIPYPYKHPDLSIEYRKKLEEGK
tara:strand:+ start:12248 stop:12523 length:276 start_codon:yes stop_codon:yes gene_type:complete